MYVQGINFKTRADIMYASYTLRSVPQGKHFFFKVEREREMRAWEESNGIRAVN